MSDTEAPRPRAKLLIRPWNLATVPSCFPSEADWIEWSAARSGACSPCEDCASAYKRRMLAAGRCDRPETIFVVDEDGEEIGLSADDPRFARLLMGLSVKGCTLRRPVPTSPAFVRLLERIERRAVAVVRRAIKTFVRRVRRGHVGDGE